MQALTDPTGNTADPVLTKGTFSADLRTKTVTDASGKAYVYYDSAKVNRN